MQIFFTVVWLALFCAGIGWFFAWIYYNITSKQKIHRLQGQLNQKDYEIYRWKLAHDKASNNYINLLKNNKFDSTVFDEDIKPEVSYTNFLDVGANLGILPFTLSDEEIKNKLQHIHQYIEESNDECITESNYSNFLKVYNYNLVKLIKKSVDESYTTFEYHDWQISISILKNTIICTFPRQFDIEYFIDVLLIEQYTNEIFDTTSDIIINENVMNITIG